MTELDDAIDRFARPRRGVSPLPEESDETAAVWALQTLLSETVIGLRRRGIEPTTTVMAATAANGQTTYKSVAPCWPLEIFALTARGVALPYTMLTGPSGTLDPQPRPDAPLLAVTPEPISIGSGPTDIEVNRRGQLTWRWAAQAAGPAKWTAGFRERFEVNWSDHRPGSLIDPIAFAIVDHLDGRIERGVVH